jgi:selenocysteine lyase/cysteine desulfurase
VSTDTVALAYRSAVTGLDRRSFIGGSGAVLAGVLGGPSVTARTPSNPGTEDDWRAVRDQFALDPDIAHFAAFVLASPPKVVRDAIERRRRALDFDTAHYIEQDIDGPVRRAAADYLAATPDEIALTNSTTVGLGIVYGGLDLAADDEVLTTEHDFYSTHEALRRAARRSGATVKRIRLYDDPSAAVSHDIVERIADGLTPRTRAVAITWVHSGTGVKLPIRGIAGAIAAYNESAAPDRPVLLCVDGLHGFGVEDETMVSLGCDVFVAGTHKWIWGPRGTGIVWASPAAWESISGPTPPFEQVHFEGWINESEPLAAPGGPANSPGGYVAFEHRMAMKEAFEFHQLVGKGAIQDRTHSQATQLKEGLAELPDVQLITPMDPDLSSGIVCLTFADMGRQFALLDELRAAGYSTSITPYRDPYLRIGPSIVTNPFEVDGLLASMKELLAV